MASDPDIATICIHGGYPHEGDGSTSRALPLHRTTSFQFKSVKHARDLFALEELGFMYTRLGNPTIDVLEKRLGLMHGGPELGGLAVASGTVAIFNAILNVAEAGDNIVAANNLYGGTMTLFGDLLPKMGITCTFVDPNTPSNFLGPHVNDRTRCFFCETCSNPALHISDMQAIADLAHGVGLPLIADDTFTTAYLQRPFDHGADVVCTSLTKWTGGHGTAIGGAIVDGGSFDWAGGRHPLYDEPDSSYHDLRWGHDLPETLKPIAFILRLRTVVLRNTGACISPDNACECCLLPLHAFDPSLTGLADSAAGHFLQGIETLPLRMEKHCANSRAVAEFLQDHPCVDWVRYPGLTHHHDLNDQYLGGKGGSMVVFGVKGGKEASANFIDALALVSHVANVGARCTSGSIRLTHSHSLTRRWLQCSSASWQAMPRHSRLIPRRRRTRR
jgi:O-acetylhomoserine (thiol)-lyase